MRKLALALSGVGLAGAVLWLSPSEARADVLFQECENPPTVTCSAGFFKNHEDVWDPVCCDESGTFTCSNLDPILSARGNDPLFALRASATEQLNRCLGCLLADEEIDPKDVSCEVIEPPSEPVCGNEVLEEGEQCDPPGRIDEVLVCNESCQIVESPEPQEPVCGNEIVEPGEDCDPPGRIDEALVCNEACQIVEDPEPQEPVCGNEIVEAGEDCDPPGPLTDRLTCDETCHTVEVPLEN